MDCIDLSIHLHELGIFFQVLCKTVKKWRVRPETPVFKSFFVQQRLMYTESVPDGALTGKSCAQISDTLLAGLLSRISK